jgi:hypothetical protein
MGSNVRLAASVAVVGFLVLALGVFRANSALPFISDCCGCGSLLAPDITQAQAVDAPTDEFGYWFVVEDCQAALAGRTREVLVEVASGAALLGGGLVASAVARRRHFSAA